jgi:CrcB protein
MVKSLYSSLEGINSIPPGCLLDATEFPIGQQAVAPFFVDKTDKCCLRRPIAAMPIYFWIAIGSMVGGVSRYALSGFIAHRFGETFPWGTFVINVTGSFAIGFFATLTQPEGRFPVGPAGRQFFMTGICGGYTTYSSFSLQTLTLARDGEWFLAGANATGTFVICFVAVYLGHVLAAALNSIRGA